MSMSNRFHSSAAGTRSPTHSRTTTVRKPSPRASSTVCRTQPAMVTPVQISVSMPPARRMPPRWVPAKALGRFLTISVSTPASGATRTSISVASVPSMRSSKGFLSG